MLASLQGEVSVLNIVSLEENPAAPGQALMLGDTIMVGDGAAVVELDDGTQVFLSSYTMLTLTQLEGTLEQPHTRFFQWMGDAYHRLDEIPAGASYEVEMVGLTANSQGGTWQSGAVFPVASVVQGSLAETQAGAPDDDGDGIPNDLDSCPTEAGPAWALDGCPQSVDGDGDGVIDSEDACPHEFGSAQENGCPILGDADGDGVADNDDLCPYEPGQTAESGCPPIGDLDGDGVADDVDRCPFQVGAPEQDGCPTASDADGDGLKDDEDACPYFPGTAADHGCPALGDADADGLPDADDRCPFIPGPPINSGCPLQEPDADYDGVSDALDGCPLEPGLPDNSGCPLAPDFDQDGVPDDRDGCPNIAAPDSEDGCPPAQDMDGDGIPDSDDACPFWAGPVDLNGCPMMVRLTTPTPTLTPTTTDIARMQQPTGEWTERPLNTETPTFTPTPKPINDAGSFWDPNCLCEVMEGTQQYEAFLLLQELMRIQQDTVRTISNIAPVPAWDVGARLPAFSPLQSAGCSGGYSSTVVNIDGQVEFSLTQPDGSQSGGMPLEVNNTLMVGGASPADPTTTTTVIMVVPPGQANATLQQMMIMSGPVAGVAIAVPLHLSNPSDDNSMPHAFLSVIQNCNCRGGPGMMYPVLASFPAGTELLIMGVSDAFGSLWWRVRIPDELETCWISGMLVESPISEDHVPQVTPPPTPTPRPQLSDGGGGGGLTCNPFASTGAECGDGLWDCTGACECVCDVLCPSFTSESTCNAHASWLCSWNGSDCVGP